VHDAPVRLDRFLVGVQLRPTTTAGIAYGLIAACGFLLPNDLSIMPELTYLAIATFVSCAVAAATCRATALWPRLVVIGLALASTLPATYAAFGDNGNRLLLAVVVAVGVSLPHATSRLLERFQGLGRPVVVAGLAYLAAGLVVIAAPSAARALVESSARRWRPIDAGAMTGLALWLTALQCAFHAATSSRYGIVPLGALAIAIGSTCGIWTLAYLRHGYYVEDGYYWELPIGKYVALPAATWLVGALLVPLARTGRSFTAMPLDHQMYADFVGPKRD